MPHKYCPANVNPSDWVQSSKSPIGRHRANVLCWRHANRLLWEMLSQHSKLFARNLNSVGGHRIKLMGSTRQLVASLGALKARVNEWGARLHADGLDCLTLDAIRSRHNAALNKVDLWQVGSPFSGITQDAHSFLRMSRLLESISLSELEAALRCLYAVGKASEQVARSASGDLGQRSLGRRAPR